MNQQLMERMVQIPSGDSVLLQGDLSLPFAPLGMVVFAHGSGSSRHSPRNQFVARELNSVGLATLLFDLLTPSEEVIDLQTRELRFDIELLATRLVGVLDWLTGQNDLYTLKIGLFGASTGAGAALVAAARRPHVVSAVVSRGGRPDLASDSLAEVQAPTLLIIGGNDQLVIDLNWKALTQLEAIRHLEIVPNASHLFEEPGALEAVATLAQDWFVEHLGL